MTAIFWVTTGTGILCLAFMAWLAARLSRTRVQLYRATRVEDLPDNPSPFIVYIAGESENVWAASMACPCGCKDVIELNLLPQVRPRWEVTENADGTVSLYPSVWRNSGCLSHFVIKSGAVEWCQSHSL